MPHVRPPVPDYDGRNSAKDIAARMWDVEAEALPVMQAEVDAVEQRLQDETDVPDFTALFLSALA